jgi:translocation and assembly module TamA
LDLLIPLLTIITVTEPQNFELCPGIVLQSPVKISFSDSEQKLVCGDPQTPGWKKIPRSQAEYLLKIFLQHQGYYFPTFRVAPPVLTVSVGKPTFVREIHANKLEGVHLNYNKLRYVRGGRLKPATLDDVSGWTLSETRRQGYGCPHIQISADPKTGIIDVQTQLGPKHYITDFERTDDPAINSAALRRFEAFQRGDELNVQNLTLTTRRMMREDLFLSAYFDFACSDVGSLALKEVLVTARPRLISFGVGADTEGGIRSRARFKNTRLGTMASSFELILSASFRDQSFDSTAQIYTSSHYPRFHLSPHLEIKRESEREYESVTGLFEFLPATTWDSSLLHLLLRAGPAFQYIYTVSGQGPRNSIFLSLNSHLMVMDHDFEYFLGEPQRGWRIQIDTESRFKHVFSDLTAHKFVLGMEQMWNLGNFEPPYITFGWRGFLGTTWIENSSIIPQELPVAMRFFLGGDANIRGFDRKEIPFNDEGFLSAVYLGLEMRAGKLFPFDLQPLIFTDLAKGSRESFDLDDRLFWAPGFGLRWNSPIGVFRATLAHGFTESFDSRLPESNRWQFFLSYGQEF